MFTEIKVNGIYLPRPDENLQFTSEKIKKEYETEAAAIEEAIPVLCKLSNWQDLEEITAKGLIPVCGARFTRTARRFRAGLTMAELALDSGVLINGEKEESFAEVEVELKQGYREEVQVMGLLLSEAYGMTPESKSKFQRSKELGAK